MILVMGIVFNLVEQIVAEEHGEATWDALIDEAGVDGAYASLGNYPDQEVMALATAACTRFDCSMDTLLRWLGKKSVPVFAERYPHFFERYRTVTPFLTSLNDFIHPEVKLLYPGASPPLFEFDTPAPDRLVITYSSERKMCMFGEGLVEGSAEHYGQRVSIEQSRCMLRGDEKCDLVIDLLT
ncbi:heme NO-binding domain-containing protein [Streptomyces erythrochromogenes]|uniref:heme NO-binding domain-containing protein n=1 Tax=Streptomyces erythrochromogenes TaxID=285574 RepID=UPI00341F29A2